MERVQIGRVVWRAGVHLLALAACVAVLWRGAGFLRLACVAFVLAAALESPIAALVRRGWRRALATVAVLAALLAVFGTTVTIAVPRVAPQVEQAVNAAPQALDRIQNAGEYRWLQRHQVIERAISKARQSVGGLLGSLFAAAAGLLSFATGMVTVAAVTVFVLLSGPAAWSWILKWLHPTQRPRVRRVVHAARRAVAGYVAGALVMAAVAATVTALTTGLLGVPYFLALAILTAALGFIPFVGAIVSGALVVTATFLTAGTTAGFVALGVFVAYQQLEGTVLQPLVQRYTISLNPLVVLFAVLLGTSAAGLFGAIIALPLAAAGKVVANDVLKQRRRSCGAFEGATAGGAPADARH